MPKLFKDLSDTELRVLLADSYLKDGASKAVAKDSARSGKDPRVILKDMFDYEDDTEVEV